jgi:hypothetical protein
MWSPRSSQSLYCLLTARLGNRLARRMALSPRVVRPLAAVAGSEARVRDCRRRRNGKRPDCEDAGEELPSPHSSPPVQGPSRLGSGWTALSARRSLANIPMARSAKRDLAWNGGWPMRRLSSTPRPTGRAQFGRWTVTSTGHGTSLSPRSSPPPAIRLPRLRPSLNVGSSPDGRRSKPGYRLGEAPLAR